MNNLEIPFGRPYIDEKDRLGVQNTLKGHILTHGPKCKLFEDKFSKFIGGGYSVTTSSCMASLHLCSFFFNLDINDEVLVSAQTHVATVHAIELMGAKPVFIDCELFTGNIDVEKITSKITKKTKGIFLVHFVGIPAEMNKICQIAKNYNLFVVEDCALSLGATYKNKHVGLWGDFGCYSFYPVKHITTGEGGMLISKNKNFAKNVANFRAFNVNRKFTDRKIPGVYDVIGVGLNYRMSEVQASLGCSQLQKLNRILKKRSKNFNYLKSLLSKIKDLSILDSHNPDAKSSHYCMVVLLNKSNQKRRNNVILKLKDKNIGTSIYYPQPVPKMKYYKNKYILNPSEYKNASLISNNSISLPVGPHLDMVHMELIHKELTNILEST